MTHKVMIITGGSRGIGAATAQIAAARGYAMCIGYHSNKEAAQAVTDAILLAGGKAIAVAADVSQEGDVLNLFQTADRELGRVDALVNNAGILEKQMRIADMNAARINRIFATNVTGSMLCAREAVRRMSTKHGGSGGAIVNLSSAAARIGSPGEYIDYAASKGAIDTFTLGLAKEVADEGIRVNAVRPGIIDTEMHASGGEPGRLERLKSTIPMQRGGQADEVAQAILWLLSDEASYTTGCLLDVTGGR
jgi:NAD(P)-dependent dehydrogenase (short-subunit alcohol dehydrogenase family)